MEMKYVENPKINEKVAKIIGELKDELVSQFHPKSIIISGSFGKGEATVIEENGKLKFLSDCEVILIPYKWIFNREKLEKFEQNFYKKTGLKVEIWGFTLTLYLFLPFLSKKIKPTIADYDLKYGSKVIYGKNYLDKIPAFKPEDIPLWEGVRLLLNRMAEALEHFSLNPSENMLFWTDKIILACQDSLLLLLNEYTPSYRERNKRFIKVSKHFNLPCIQTLVEFAKGATHRKLGSNSAISMDRRLEYWFEVQKVCDEVLRYILKEGYSIEFKDYIEFQEKYLSSELKNYTTLPFDNVILQNLFRFFKGRIIGNKLPTLKMLSKLRRWDHIIYTLIPLIYFALGKDLKVNTSYLRRISEVVFWEKIKADSSFKSWGITKDVVISSWRQMML